MADLLQNKVVITDLSRFKKVYDLSGNERVGLPSGTSAERNSGRSSRARPSSSTASAITSWPATSTTTS